MRVLILEDDQMRIDEFVLRLQKQIKNIVIDITDSSTKAINFIKTNEYDVVFLDHDLGGLQNEWDEEDCGMRVVDYIINKNIYKSKYIIHSLNIPRANIMYNKLNDNNFIVEKRPFVWKQL